MVQQTQTWFDVVPDWMRIVIGLALVIFFGDVLVAAAVHLGRRYNISKAILGLTVLAVGTSIPELGISINSILFAPHGHAEGRADAIAMGNIVGSNICNILFVLAIPAMIYRLCCAETRVITVNAVVMLVITFVFLVVIFLGGQTLDRTDGFILLAGLGVFLIVCFMQARQAGEKAFADQVDEFEGERVLGLRKPGVTVAALIIIASAGALWLSAHFTVYAAADLVRATDGLVSHGIIGLSIIAFGTSLPELSTTIAAARKKEYAMAIGNVVGSNIFNIATIGGISAIAASFRSARPTIQFENMNATALIPSGIWFDLAVMTVTTAVLTAIILLRRGRIERITGLVFLTAYIAYIVYLYWPAVSPNAS